jgi:tetratricopeptide (TPR) repeat protein
VQPGTLRASAVHHAIEREVAQLARFYRVDGPALDAVLQRFDFDAYTEVILGRDGFELLVGEVGAPDRLAHLAREVDVPGQTVSLFRAFSARFPGRMGYLKLGFGDPSNPPTMHCAAMVPWSEVSGFMRQQSAFAGAVESLNRVALDYPLCHLVGFTRHASLDVDVMKIYWLLDRNGHDDRAPMLASARIADGRFTPESKEYVMGARWEDAATDDRWREIVETARREFTASAWLCTSQLSVAGEVRERKVYVFRHDARVADSERARSFNLYYAQGLHHLQEGEVTHAVRSFTNAIAFQPDYGHAYNNRGYCWIQKREYWRAIADCATARAFDSTISSKNLDFAGTLAQHPMNSADWAAFEKSLARGRIGLTDSPGRQPDLLDLRDGAVMLEALLDSAPAVIPDSSFVLRPDAGSGDCLFRSLADEEVDGRTLLAMRRRVASIRLTMPEDPRANTLHVVAALLQTPGTRDRGLALVAGGVTGLRNEVYAALQRVQGIFAGEPELEQWCSLTGTGVGVVETTGALRQFSARGCRDIAADARHECWRELRAMLARDMPVLLRTTGHWRRVLRIREHADLP